MCIDSCFVFFLGGVIGTMYTDEHSLNSKNVSMPDYSTNANLHPQSLGRSHQWFKTKHNNIHNNKSDIHYTFHTTETPQTLMVRLFVCY